MNECACFEDWRSVDILSASYVGGCEVEVTHDCPIEGHVRSDVVDVDYAPEALRLLPADELAQLAADMRTAGDQDPYRSLLDRALELLGERCYGRAADVFDWATFGWIERSTADQAIRQLRSMLADHGEYRSIVERAAQCIDVAREHLQPIDADVESKARAEREVIEAADEMHERRAA